MPDDQRAGHEYYAEEYGDIQFPEAEPDPAQGQRRERLAKRAYKARKQYNIAFEDAFKADTVYRKYAPNNWNDVI